MKRVNVRVREGLVEQAASSSSNKAVDTDCMTSERGHEQYRGRVQYDGAGEQNPDGNVAEATAATKNTVR